jgi:hypothetical protein
VGLIPPEDLVAQVPQAERRPHDEGERRTDSVESPGHRIFRLYRILPFPKQETVPRTPAAGRPAPTTPRFRFAAYGDTRDNHDIHREIVKERT